VRCCRHMQTLRVVAGTAAAILILIIGTAFLPAVRRAERTKEAQQHRVCNRELGAGAIDPSIIEGDEQSPHNQQRGHSRGATRFP
jgi:hypothetical protein